MVELDFDFVKKNWLGICVAGIIGLAHEIGVSLFVVYSVIG